MKPACGWQSVMCRAFWSACPDTYQRGLVIGGGARPPLNGIHGLDNGWANQHHEQHGQEKYDHWHGQLSR